MLSFSPIARSTGRCTHKYIFKAIGTWESLISEPNTNTTFAIFSHEKFSTRQKLRFAMINNIRESTFCHIRIIIDVQAGSSLDAASSERKYFTQIDKRAIIFVTKVFWTYFISCPDGKEQKTKKPLMMTSWHAICLIFTLFFIHFSVPHFFPNPTRHHKSIFALRQTSHFNIFN